jgi:hypothetical protein
MTGQRWDGRFGRARVGPLQADVPTRLPGGLWGPPPASGIVEFDPNGGPTNGWGPVASANATLGQSEWPLPVRWEVQASVTLTLVSGTIVGSVWPQNSAAQAFAARLRVISSVESATGVDEVDLAFGPGLYPPRNNFHHQLQPNRPYPWSQSYVYTAQTLRFELVSLTGQQEASLASTSWRWSLSILPALTSAGWPA